MVSIPHSAVNDIRLSECGNNNTIHFLFSIYFLPSTSFLLSTSRVWKQGVLRASKQVTAPNTTYSCCYSTAGILLSACICNCDFQSFLCPFSFLILILLFIAFSSSGRSCDPFHRPPGRLCCHPADSSHLFTVLSQVDTSQLPASTCACPFLDRQHTQTLSFAVHLIKQSSYLQLLWSNIHLNSHFIILRIIGSIGSGRSHIWTLDRDMIL